MPIREALRSGRLTMVATVEAVAAATDGETSWPKAKAFLYVYVIAQI